MPNRLRFFLGRTSMNSPRSAAIAREEPEGWDRLMAASGSALAARPEEA
jgi:hypothetical protein